LHLDFPPVSHEIAVWYCIASLDATPRALRTLQARLVYEETRAAAKRAGAAGFFRKPVDDQALLDALAWAIGDNHKNHA